MKQWQEPKANKDLLEKEWQQQLTDLAEWYGWRWSHFRPAKTSHGWRTPVSGTIGKGWPDLTLAHEGQKRIIFVECKRVGKVPDETQQMVLDFLKACGQEVYVWTPDDLDEAERTFGPQPS